MKWFYIWSEKYSEFNEYLQKTLKNKFELYPIYIPQERFNKELNLINNNSHIWSRCTIKLNTIIDILKSTVLDNDELFVFSDVDIFIRPNCLPQINNCFDLYDSFAYDLVFSQEKDDSYLQMGTMLIRKKNSVLTFWETILNRCLLDPTLLDQNIMNEEIQNMNNVTCFRITEVLNCLTLSEVNKRIYLIYNLMTTEKDIDNNIRHKKKEFNKAIEYYISWNSNTEIESDLIKMKMVI